MLPCVYGLTVAPAAAPGAAHSGSSPGGSGLFRLTSATSGAVRLAGQRLGLYRIIWLAACYGLCWAQSCSLIWASLRRASSAISGTGAPTLHWNSFRASKSLLWA